MLPFSSFLFSRFVLSAMAVLASLRLGTGVFAGNATTRLERPTYSVLRRLPGGVEIRRYEPYLIAETSQAGGQREGTKKGFRAVAGYIFGKNKPKTRMWLSSAASSDDAGTKMAMTAPVRTTSDGDDTRVSFVLGSDYTLASAPVPLDRSVKVKKVGAHVLACRSFSGPPPSEARVQREADRVRDALCKANMRPKAAEKVLVYGYHDPFITPNILRRNEVGVFVEEASV